MVVLWMMAVAERKNAAKNISMVNDAKIVLKNNFL
jgi:hypothetical protein